MTRIRPVALSTSLTLALAGTLLTLAPQGAQAIPRAIAVSTVPRTI